MFTNMTYESKHSAAVLCLDRQREQAKQRTKMAEQATEMVRRLEFGQRKARRNLMAQFDRASLDVQKGQLEKKREQLEEAEKERDEAKEQKKRAEMMVEGEKRKVEMVLGGYEEMVMGHSFPATSDNLGYSIQSIQKQEEMRKEKKKAAEKLEKMKKKIEETKKNLRKVQETVQEKEAAIAEITQLQNLTYEKNERLDMLGDQMKMRNAVSIDKERMMREYMKMKDQNRERLKAQLQAVQEGRIL